MFEQAPSFMCTMRGPEHVYDFVNDAHRRLFNSADWIGKPARAAMPDLEGQGYFKKLDHVFATGKRFIGRASPLRFRYTPDAPEEERLIDFIFEPLRDEWGTIGGIFCEGFDVTEARRAELALRESEQRFHEIADAAPVIIWMSDESGACTWFNRSALDFTGRPMEAELGSGWADNVHSDDLEPVLANFALAYERRESFHTTFRLRRRDGKWRILDEHAVPRFSADGSFMGFIGSCTDITEQHEAAEALRRSEQQLRLATESAEIGLWDIDLVTGAAHAQPRVSEMFGISPDAQTSVEDFFALIHPDDNDMAREAFAAALDPERRTAYDVEYRTIGKDDGLLRWVAAKGRGIFDADGRCVRVIGTAIDISRHRETAEALRRSEEQLRLATEYAEVGLWDVDILNDIVYWPPRVRTMFGISPDEPVTLAEFRARIHPDDRRGTIAAILAACDPDIRAPYDVEYRVSGKNDGVGRWLAAKGRAIFDDENRCVRMLGITVDISARKEIERQVRELNESLERRVAERTAALEQSERNIRTILETSHLYQGLLSIDGTVLFANGTSLAGIRATLEDVIGRPFWESPWFAATPGMPEAVKSAVASVAAGNTANLGIALDMPIGLRSFDFSLRPVKDDTGTVVAMVPEAVDITARVKAEQALQQAQKMEAIGNLTGGIAHDFNNLLQGVSGSLDLIRRRPDDADRVHRWAEAGLQAAERGAKLTAQLLAFSRSQKLELRPLDLTALLLGMRELLDRTLGPAVRVKMDFEVHPPAVMGDETQLELAVLNLAINARDAMQDGGDLIIATRRRAIVDDAELEPGDYIELSVTDSGWGMSPDVVAHAFDPFFTTKGVGKGTGLGLSQVYAMARQAGGSARIRSAPGAGTTVSLVLRQTDRNAERDHARVGADGAPDAVSATILVADDDPDVRNFLNESLNCLGYAVLLAEDGRAALAALSRAQPDAMIVDYAMPGMTGAELAQRARVRNPALPIVFASGYAESSELENVTDDNTLLLRKPFRVSDLQDALNKALRR
jgi:PAS domain S-box-containing protein